MALEEETEVLKGVNIDGDTQVRIGHNKEEWTR